MAPYREIHALYDKYTITVYQAYSATIADATVKTQHPSSSSEFNLQRGFTWIKPSWSWMLYRSGYSLKDDHQARILAIRMKHSYFQELLSHVAVMHDKLTEDEQAKLVRVQWDPERTPRLEVLPYRSIQIGIGKGLAEKWIEEWIESIEDVTERVRGLETAVEGYRETSVEIVKEKGWMPLEREYVVSKELRRILKMDEEVGRESQGMQEGEV